MFAIATASIQVLNNIQVIADIFQNLFTIAAIIVGGIWIYFNFFKGRTYRMRLEPEVSGKVVTLNGLSHLVVTASLKNVGLSNVEIEQEASALQLLSYEVPVSTTVVLSAAWEDVTAFPVFESRAGVKPGEVIDQRIEPGEVIEDERLIMVPSNERMAFQLPPVQHVVAKLHGGWSPSARSRLLSHRLFTKSYPNF
jgi:hypothetical protein